MKQLSLIEEEQALWTCSDDWETPDRIARFMGSLVKSTDLQILEPAAGTGQIAQYLPEMTLCIEINPLRFEIGAARHSDQDWMRADFLASSIPEFLKVRDRYPFDLIITNPPFSLAIEFIERSLSLLNPANSDARLLFLLPTDFFQSGGRNATFQKMNAHIHHKYEIVNRVAYLKNGIPKDDRQIYDAVYDIRPGKLGGCITFVNA